MNAVENNHFSSMVGMKDERDAAVMEAPRNPYVADEEDELVREWIDWIMCIYLIVVLGILNILLIQRTLDGMLLSDLKAEKAEAEKAATERESQQKRRSRSRSRATARQSKPSSGDVIVSDANDKSNPTNREALEIISEEGGAIKQSAQIVDVEKKPPPSGVKTPENLIDLSGSFKLERKIGFQEFLASQGVSWALRKAADKANPTNKITHDMENHNVTIGVEGIISSSTTYKVDGPPIETKIQSKSFMDTMRYLDSGDGVIVTKQNKEDGYYITVKRQISSNKQEMTITSTAIWPNKQVESVQYFSRIK